MGVQLGMVWLVWAYVCIMMDFGYVDFFFFDPSLANLSASSFPIIFLCAFIFCIFIKAFRFVRYFAISCSIILSGWLFWVMECLSFVLMRHMEFRLYVNMYVEFVSLFVILSVSYIANSLALKMFWSPWSLYDRRNILFFIIYIVAYNVTWFFWILWFRWCI
jgi:hypothetical protein